MKRFTKAVMFMSLLSVVGCSTDDNMSVDSVVEVRTDPKLYTTTVGTYIDIKNDDYDYSDSRGSLLLKKQNGSILLASDMIGSVHGEVTYELTNIDGQTYTRRELVSSAFRTDVNGDFNTDLLYDTNPREAVSAIVSMNVTLTVIDNDVAYERKIDFSTESIWDAAMGLGSAIFEYDIVRHHAKFYDYDNELAQSFDINADVVHTEASDQAKAKMMVAQSKVTKRNK